MRSIQEKKGMSIGDMYPAVLTIVLVGIVLGVGLFTLSTLHDNITASYSYIQNDINTSVGAPGQDGTTTLANASLANYNLTTVSVVNGTDGASVTNYTYTGAGVITWGADVILVGNLTLVNVTSAFTYDATGTAEESVTTTITGLATFADWIAIIVVVIAAAIVLGVVLSSFGRRRNAI